MTNAQVLRLHQNELSSSIPSELGLLDGLLQLNLEENNLTGFIPTELGWLALNASLGAVNVTGNKGLVGRIPEGLCVLPEKESPARWLFPHMDYNCSNSLCGCDDCACGFNVTTGA